MGIRCCINCNTHGAKMHTLKESEKIQNFIEELERFMPEKAKIVLALRDMILNVKPGIAEGFMYGGLVYKTDYLVWGIFSAKNHITIEFVKGHVLEDPFSVLQGTGKERRHIKIKTFDEIENKRVLHYITASVPCS